MKQAKLLVLLLFLSQMGFSQFLGRVTYKTKIVYTKYLKADSTLKSYTLDTIRYNVPFEVTFTQKSVMIDGYGSFAVESYRKNGDANSVFHHYKLKNGNYVTIGEKNMYLVYPLVKLKYQIVMFEIDQDIH